MITLYPLKYNNYKNYYKALNFEFDNTTSTLYLSGFFVNKVINNAIVINKARLKTSTTVLYNSLTVFYTYLMIDLNTYTYASNTIPFNSAEPHKPEFLVYFDTNLNVIDSSITSQYYSHYSDTSNYSLTALTLNGYTASVNPNAYQIPILDGNANLVLPYTNAIVTKNYIFRRVDLTNATSDYPLAVGEEAIYNFTNTSIVPLHIATFDGSMYEMHVIPSNPSGTTGAVYREIYLYPNNLIYQNEFIYYQMYINSREINATNNVRLLYSAFRIGFAFSSIDITITNRTMYKDIKGIIHVYGTEIDLSTIVIYNCSWTNITTSWTSLGTILFPQETSGQIIIKRIM